MAMNKTKILGSFLFCIFRNYQKNLEEAAQKRIEGLSLEEKVEEVIVEKDQIFGDEPVPKRYYDRVL